jgi:signal transduction histidine kinase
MTERSDDLFIRRSLLRLLVEHTPTSVFGNLAVAAVATGVLTYAARGPVAAVWAAAIIAIAAARVLYYRRVAAALTRIDIAGLDRIEARLIVLVGINGLLWGLLPWIGYTGEDPYIDFFTVAMLVGMTSGGTPSLSAIPRALAVYLAVTLLPFFVRAIQIGGMVSVAGGVAILLALIVLAGVGRSTYRSLRRTLHLSFENAQLAKALQEAMRAKDLFQAGVTHDLRQLVTALAFHMHYLRSLGTNVNAQETAAGWRAIESALAGMDGQLTRLLDLSRLESGEIEPEIRDVCLDEILRACRSRFAAEAERKGLKLRFRPARAVVRADPTMLQSMIDNLVCNAVRYTETGGVLVGARRRGGRVELQVYDTGPGIPASLIPQLFVAYRRFSDTRNAARGHGLGLALVSKQAQLQGHEVTVRSLPGRGSLFGVSMPCGDGVRRRAAVAVARERGL